MKLLLVYATAEGQTRKVASFVAEHLKQRGHETHMVNAGTPGPIDVRGYDAVIIAASVHMGRYQAAIVRFVRRHVDAIDTRPNAFLSVSLAAASSDQSDTQGIARCVAKFIGRTGWSPRLIHHVAGAFRYTSYSFLKRCVMKHIARRKGAPADTSRDHELTDWADLACFVDSFMTSIIG
jgi:menaquinone-dependent protoporphyrinogen oxidase